MTRIALVSSSYHPYPGGVEEHVRNVARELSGKHEVEVWTVDRGEHLGVQSIDGITVRYLPTPLPNASPRGAAAFLRAGPAAWGAWRQAARTFRPEVLHIHCFGPNGPYGAALARVSRLPLVLSAHGETFMDQDDVFSISRLMSASLRSALRQATVVTGCSAIVIEDLQTRFGLVGGVVVPNGINLTEADDLEMPPGHTFPRPYVFAVGRLVPVKGFDLLIRAFARAKLADDLTLVIGGDGPEIDRLRALGEGLGLGDRLLLPGRLGRPDVLAGMADAEVVVVPSRVEAFGIVVLEAWRSGTALLATNRGGPADFVEDGQTGLLVDPEDVDDLAGALNRLISDEGLRERLASRGLQEVIRYPWSHTADCYTALYEANGI